MENSVCKISWQLVVNWLRNPRNSFILVDVFNVNLTIVVDTQVTKITVWSQTLDPGRCRHFNHRVTFNVQLMRAHINLNSFAKIDITAIEIALDIDAKRHYITCGAIAYLTCRWEALCVSLYCTALYCITKLKYFCINHGDQRAFQFDII